MGAATYVTKAVVRSIAALIGSVFVWVGVWELFDDNSFDKGVVRDFFFVLIGFIFLIATRTFFLNAGIMTLHDLHETMRVHGKKRTVFEAYRVCDDVQFDDTRFNVLTRYARAFFAVPAVLLVWVGLFDFMTNTVPDTRAGLLKDVLCLVLGVLLLLLSGAVTSFGGITVKPPAAGASSSAAGGGAARDDEEKKEAKQQRRRSRNEAAAARAEEPNETNGDTADPSPARPPPLEVYSSDDEDVHAALVDGKETRPDAPQGVVDLSKLSCGPFTWAYTCGIMAFFGAIIAWVGVYHVMEVRMPGKGAVREVIYFLLGVTGLLVTQALVAKSVLSDNQPSAEEEAQRRKELPARLNQVAGVLSFVFFWCGLQTLLLQYTFPDTVYRCLVYALVGVVLLVLTNTLHVNAGVLTPMSFALNYQTFAFRLEDEGAGPEGDGELAKDS